MTRLEAIDALLTRVKAESARVSSDFASVWTERREHGDHDEAEHASAGYPRSTAAATALWRQAVEEAAWRFGNKSPRAISECAQGMFLEPADTPARALLIAILEALKAQEKAND